MTVALAGNPNVGKSTLFNALTGLRQHTGNWPGKTVGKVSGYASYQGRQIELIDLPGTYSLEGKSEDERIAAEYIARNEADRVLVVCDGSCLERTLILALQILDRTDRVILCINLMDEAKRRGIQVDGEVLGKMLGVPVVMTSAGDRLGLEQLQNQMILPLQERCPTYFYDDPVEAAEELTALCVCVTPTNQNWRYVLDRILVSRRYGIPILMMLLFLIVSFVFLFLFLTVDMYC